MREILFRGKTPITETWVYGTGLLYDGINTWIVSNEPPTPLAFGEKHFVVIPKTVGQFTGLFDKNGKRIFEGDIVKYYHSKTNYGVMMVAWYEEAAHFVLTFSDELYYCEHLMKSHIYCEVIGNIHDNPELLR